jgi:hypothetical protein
VNGPASRASWASVTLAGGLLGGAARDELGTTLAFLGDTDGDGTPEIAAGAPLGLSGYGYVQIASSTLAPLARLDGNAPGQRMGTALAGGDLDGDGLADLALSHALSRTFIVQGRGAGLPSGEVASDSLPHCRKRSTAVFVRLGRRP